MVVRHYNEDDLDGVMSLLEELRGSKEAEGFSFYLMDSNTYKRSYLSAKNYIALVAIIDKQIAGFMIAEHWTNYIVNVTMLYVGESYRRNGVAIALKNGLVSLAKARGYASIVSQVRMNNENSIALNQKAGWAQEIDKIYPDYYLWFTKNL